MRFSNILAAGAALGAALLAPATASPTVMSRIPDHISPNVRRELAAMPASDYTLYQRQVGRGHAHKRGAQINGVQLGCKRKNCLSITFDDGPYLYERKIVNTLANAGNQKATFFVNGNNWRCIYDQPQVDALRYTYEHKHQICSHTWSHPNISTLTNRQLDVQVQLVEDALWKIIGAVPACIRAPYGEIRPDQVRYLNDRWGLVVVGWNEDTGDADGAGVQAGLDLYHRLHTPEQAIVLNHETVKATANTVIPQAVNLVKQNGYSGSHTVGHTVGFKPYKVVGNYQNRDSSWTCDGTPAPGAS
ncbi:related to deacetylase [Sporisorium reilianum f. sp. reilianum]|uniref:Related to deacetylase n=1 Tax=Sporisorium reilianum f. sp. reilianum TaxID=72559 RepID=A0A2N8UAY2_9BASI|nr:related to deacetylase [Sporisorium reilianum f. sp. reilianum]